ncbi:SFRS2 [Mytilus edulis]|uniref:Serine/arginine-rich splicing factor 2 n=1 Tax=Mytilus edulis TaxID=6550 RepID=A0A8S3V0S3_MYTED|nr:SFRS2 [Mytilus edulis]
MSYSRPPPNTERMSSLKVDNLTFRTTPEDLRRAFEKYGEVGDIYIPRDRFTRKSRGFAFVRYYDKRDAEDALDSMDRAMLDGRELRVQMARYGRPSNDRRGGRRGEVEVMAEVVAGMEIEAETEMEEEVDMEVVTVVVAVGTGIVGGDLTGPDLEVGADLDQGVDLTVPEVVARVGLALGQGHKPNDK